MSEVGCLFHGGKMYAIETTKLTKRYRSLFGRLAVDGLDLKVERGEIFGFLGPNGAGKTTTVKMLLGIVLPTSGSAKVLGHDVRDVRARENVGYLPERQSYPGHMTAEGVLELFGKLSGMEGGRRKRRIGEVLELVGLDGWRKVKVRKYSKGMVQRLGLANAILHDPDVVFLDEPTAGIDPIGRKVVKDLLLHLKEEGKTIFLNSHILSEVEMICDRVGILHRGRLIKVGSVRELTLRVEEYIVEAENLPEGIERDVEALVISCAKEGGTLRLSLESPEDINQVVDLLRSKGAKVRSVQPRRVSLEDVFVELIKGEA